MHAIGLRSKTQLTASVLKEAKNLLCIGCFCIGTNQVDLEYAASRGVSLINFDAYNHAHIVLLDCCF